VVAIIGITKQTIPAAPRTSPQNGGSNDIAETMLANIRKTPSAMQKNVSMLSMLLPSSDVEHEPHMAQWLRLVNSKKHRKAKKVNSHAQNVYILKHEADAVWLVMW
jgi:hypothetical protein